MARSVRCEDGKPSTFQPHPEAVEEAETHAARQEALGAGMLHARAEAERVSALSLGLHCVPEGRDCQRGASGTVPKSGGDHQAPHLEQSLLVCPGRTQASAPPEQGATPHMQEGGWVWIPDPFSSHRRRLDGVRGNRAHRS